MQSRIKRGKRPKIEIVADILILYALKADLIG